MANGWNNDYLNFKIRELDDKIKQENDLQEKERLEDIVEIYKSLILTKLFQTGKVYDSEVTVDDFLSEYNDATNPYYYPKYINNSSYRIAKIFLSLEPITGDLSLNNKIKYKDATDLIYEFLKSEFSEYDAKIFHDYFIKNRSFVLLDKINENGSVTIADKELFIALPNTKDIRFLGQMAHEAGHVKRIIVNDTMEINTLLGEFESFTYEIRFILWLIKNNIYRSDAIKYILNQMILLENNSIIRYYNDLYGLNKLESSEEFIEMVQKLHLLDRPNINTYQDVIDYIFTILSSDYVMYLFSYMAVINELDNPNFYDTYDGVIKSVGNISEKRIQKNQNLADFSDIKKYTKIRSEMLSRLREE